MKYIFGLFIVLISFGSISCKKEELKPATTTVITQEDNQNIVGPVWVLYSGKLMIENTTNGGAQAYYDHFGPNRPVSNLDVFSPTVIPFDNIEKDVTTWEFKTNSMFVLNGIKSYQYKVITSSGVYQPYGLENGSARPIEIINSTADYMNIKVYESNGSDSLYDYHYYTILTFVRQGFGGTVEEYKPSSLWPYQGVVPTTTTTTPPVSSGLTGTKWVVVKYVQNFVTQNVSDTLTFTSPNTYVINSTTTQRTYLLTSVTGTNMKNLSLYSFTTLGGDYSGQVQSTFIQDGVINNGLFTNIFNSNVPDCRVWMNRIQ